MVLFALLVLSLLCLNLVPMTHQAMPPVVRVKIVDFFGLRIMLHDASSLLDVHLLKSQFSTGNQLCRSRISVWDGEQVQIYIILKDPLM